MADNVMNHNMMIQDVSPNMLGQERSSNMRDMHRQNQAFAPNQYFVKDDFGNYAYSYNDQQSEKSEERNAQSIKGQYAYVMSNGVKRRVEYVADNNGFHIIRDNADPSRIKRSSEPDIIQTRMESVMDASPLRDDARDMYRVSNMLGHDMSSNRDGNLMGMNQHRYSDLMGQDSLNRNIMGQETMGHNIMVQETMGRNMMGQKTMGHKMMGRNIYNIMSNRGLTSGVSNMMDQQMNTNVMGQDMTMNVMSRNMGLDRNSQMMGRHMLGNQKMTPNMMYINMMDLSNNGMSSNMMNNREMTSDSLVNNGLMGQRMMQKMEIERVPE